MQAGWPHLAELDLLQPSNLGNLLMEGIEIHLASELFYPISRPGVNCQPQVSYPINLPRKQQNAMKLNNIMFKKTKSIGHLKSYF